MRIESPLKTVLGIFPGVNGMVYDFEYLPWGCRNRGGWVGAPVDGLKISTIMVAMMSDMGSTSSAVQPQPGLR